MVDTLADWLFRKRDALCVRCTGSPLDKRPGAINRFCGGCFKEVHRELPSGWRWNDNFSGIYQIRNADLDALQLSVGG